MKASRREWAFFLGPWLLGFVVLTAIPLAFTVGFSFVEQDPSAKESSARVVGLDHYRQALGLDHSRPAKPSDPWIWRACGFRPTDPKFWFALQNSAVFTLLWTPVGLAAAIVLSLLLYPPRPGMRWFRAVVFAPYAMGGVAAILIWSWLLNPEFGAVNQFLRSLPGNFNPPEWLFSPTWCKPAVVGIHLWSVGGAVIVFLAARRCVPPTLYDAARLDGAGSWSCFRAVTWPAITPVVLFWTLTTVIYSMQSFNDSFLLRNRRQGDGLLFYAVHLYQSAFEPPYRLAYACALACILAAILSGFAALLMGTSRWWVHYGDEHARR